MSSCLEVLGLSLPYSSSISATNPGRDYSPKRVTVVELDDQRKCKNVIVPRSI
jgi:dihydroxyacid dehydratase/phosphogluconate dehydratase